LSGLGTAEANQILEFSGRNGGAATTRDGEYLAPGDAIARLPFHSPRDGEAMPRISKPRPKRAAARTNGASAEAQALTVSITHDEIARRAYELFEQSGAAHGSDLQHWFEAERQLLQRP
jgi:hypothetical protein